MAAVLVAWLRAEHHEVWQEVNAPFAGGPCFDVVTVRGPAVHVIQCKLSLSLSLLDQAITALPLAHYVSVAVPYGRSHKAGTAVRSICHCHGIGILGVNDNPRSCEPIHVALRPKMHRDRSKGWTNYAEWLRRNLETTPQDYGVAGAKVTPRYSAFRATCDNVTEFVTEHPGCTVSEMMAGISHHYSSDVTARGCIYKWLGSQIPVRRERAGRSFRLYPR